MKTLLPYIQIARPDHWFKQFFMLPGLCLAFLFLKDIPDGMLGNLLLGLFSTCCIASANYRSTNIWTPRSTGSIPRNASARQHRASFA